MRTIGKYTLEFKVDVKNANGSLRTVSIFGQFNSMAQVNSKIRSAKGGLNGWAYDFQVINNVTGQTKKLSQ